MLFDLHSSPELTRFRVESERLQSMFVNHVLICTEPKERADRIVHLLDVVDVLLELRSFHAVMLIVMALQSTPIHRLKQTWALVGKLAWPRRFGLFDAT
jgi:son of sevenless-like protein